MADLTLPEVITRFRGNEARIAEFTNGNAAGYYITVDGKKVETLPSVVSRLAAAIAAASATADTLKGTGGAKLIGYGATTVDAALTTQAKGIADNAKAVADLDAGKLGKGGGTMTGALKLSSAPTDPLHAATKGWAEALIGAYWKPAIGDSLTTFRGAPDTNWILDGANYLQSSYPELFAKLGLLQCETAVSGSSWPSVSTEVSAGFLGVGKDGVLISAPNASSNSVIKRSTDGGVTFTSQTSPLQYLQKLGTDGNGVWVGGTGSGAVTQLLIRSTDNGLTWSVITLPKAVGLGSDIFTDGNGTWLFKGNAGVLWRSIDNGATWGETTGPCSSVCAVGGGVWYGIAFGNPYVYKSTDNGATWAQIGTAQMGGSQTLTMTAIGCGLVNGAMMLAYQGIFTPANSSTTYHVLATSLDGINWRQAQKTFNAGYASRIVFGRENFAIAASYTSNMVRMTALALDPTHPSGTANFTLDSFVIAATWPQTVCTDGLGTWYASSNSSGGTCKAAAAYDVRTLFRVPKLAALPTPAATYIKAK